MSSASNSHPTKPTDSASSEPDSTSSTPDPAPPKAPASLPRPIGKKVKRAPVTVSKGDWGTTIQKTSTVLQRPDLIDIDLTDEDEFRVVPPDSEPLEAFFGSLSEAEPTFLDSEETLEKAFKGNNKDRRQTPKA